MRTYDGLHWRDMDYVVASDIQHDRPGMAMTRRLADGQWMMTYELGGPAHFIVYYRLSDDGWDWGSPTNVGSEIRLPNSAFPAHAPRFTVMPGGAILLVAQLIEKSGTEAWRAEWSCSVGEQRRKSRDALADHTCPCARA